MDAPGGVATGVLVGPIADRFASTTGSAAPVVIEVATLKRFKRHDCRRFNLCLKQANVPTREGKLADFGVDYGLNVCRDGSAPSEEMGLNGEGEWQQTNK